MPIATFLPHAFRPVDSPVLRLTAAGLIACLAMHVLPAEAAPETRGVAANGTSRHVVPAPAVRLTSESSPLTLKAAIAHAVAEHPRVRAAHLDVTAALAREVQAAAGPNPNLAMTIDQVPFAAPGAGNYMAGVAQPLLPTALREAQMGMARIDRESTELALGIARLDLATKVMAAYARALHEGEGLRLARDTVEHARWLARAAKARWKAGDVAQVESLRAEVAAARAEQGLREAEGATAQARARVNVLLGRDAQAQLTLVALKAPRVGALPTTAVLVARAINTRAEFRRAELAVQREALQRQAALAGIWTGTEIAASLGSVGGQPGFSTTLALPIPLYRRQGEAAEAEANRLRAQAEGDALRHEVTLDVEQTWREATLAADLATRFATDYVPRATQFAANARRRFEAGEGTGVEVAEAAHTLHEARAERQQAVLAWHEALARLERAVGSEAWDLEGGL